MFQTENYKDTNKYLKIQGCKQRCINMDTSRERGNQTLIMVRGRIEKTHLYKENYGNREKEKYTGGHKQRQTYMEADRELAAGKVNSEQSQRSL